MRESRHDRPARHHPAAGGRHVAATLEGYRILDLTIWQQGTYATAMLADMGADVIKIESYSNPDPGRGLRIPDGRQAYFHSLNRGKRSILLDLKNEAGQEAFWRLVKTADVFHNNMRYGVMERLGVTFEKLQEVNPGCILSNASGWGHLGPDAYDGAMDTLAQARGGFMSVTGEGEDGMPQMAGFPQADHVGALVSGYSIVLALLHRERTGEAQEVNTSLYGSQINIQSFNITASMWSGERRTRLHHNERPPTWNHYQAGDGKWFMIGALPPDKWWAEFCDVMGLPELCEGEFATHALRSKRNREVIRRMDEVFLTRTRDEWVAAFQARNLLVQPIMDYDEIAADPQAWANDYLVKVPDETGKEWPMVGSPVNLSKSPAQIRRQAPEFGEHTESVLLEAGYSRTRSRASVRRARSGAPKA
ncbi:MAG: CoA transferase [Dehalococcoidia bacterium]|nr:CoA transferase [Dehalococcoidia bacterium]